MSGTTASEEERWCDERATDVAACAQRLCPEHGRIGERPAWFAMPYAGLWAIESAHRPEWIGWWVIAGDLPTDALPAHDLATPRDAMRAFGKRWVLHGQALDRGEVPAAWSDRADDELPKLAAQLKRRGAALEAWADDAASWPRRRSVNEAGDPYLRDELDARSLHFSSSAIQSRMLLRQPDALALEYTRSMMAWPMLRPMARRLGMIGLGGGSIAKFCHRHLADCMLTVVEIDPRVIALRDAFRLPPDDGRLKVVEADGARFIADTDLRFEVLMIDAFDAEGMPAALGTQRFYDDCLDVLMPAGLLVVNLHAGHAAMPTYLARIRRSFGPRLVVVDDRDGSNRVAFAAKGGVFEQPGSGWSRKPANLDEAGCKALLGAFSRLAHALGISRHDDH